MKKISAFIMAFVLFSGTVLGMHFYSVKKLKFNNNDFGTWNNSVKTDSPEAIKANLNQGSLPVFGSSEFQHGAKTSFYPRAMFKGDTFAPMLLGAAYYQDLDHAITLAAIGNDIPNKKAVIFLSPSWFKKNGVSDRAYSSRFSEITYLEMLKNKDLSEKTKKYMMDRTNKLLKADPPTLKRVELYNRVYLGENLSLGDKVSYKILKGFLSEKSIESIVMQGKLAGLKENTNKDLTDKPIDWQGYLEKATLNGEKHQSNKFFMNERKYKHYAKLKKKKGGGSELYPSKFTFSDSPEYDDLKCFLDVCKELNIEPMVVMLPVNGYLYDYRGYEKADRDVYYDNIRNITSKYNVDLSDLSDHEYTKYFFEDGVHLSGKGWVFVNEAIYDFYRKGKN